MPTRRIGGRGLGGDLFELSVVFKDHELSLKPEVRIDNRS